MKVLPYTRLTFRTGSSPDVVGEQVAALLSPAWFRSTKASSPFRGRIQGMHFKIRRILGYGNSFQPVVIGDIAPGAFGGSEVRVRMRLQALVIAFMVVWFGFLSIIAVAFVVQSARRRDAHATGDFGFFGGLAMFAGMALFMYGLTSAAFWYEVKKAKSLLLEAFGAGTEINED